jgi:hypothetical protein
MKSFQLLRTITAKGESFFVDGKRVSRDSFLELKCGPGKRLDCLITRSNRHATRDWLTVTIGG